MFYLTLLFGLAFILQYALTFLQIRGFNEAYRDYRRRGYRAAIGKFSGKFHAGAIVMFAIDDKGFIVEGTAMQGVTNFARFKPFSLFNGVNVENLNQIDFKEMRLSYSKQKAVLDCHQNYLAFVRGEEIPVPPSPFQKVSGAVKNMFKKRPGLPAADMNQRRTS